MTTPGRTGPRVLVTGAAGPAGRSVLAQLTARGVAVVGVDAAPSGHGPSLRRVPLAGDRYFVPELLRVARQVGADLLVPTVSEELPVLAAARAAGCTAGLDVVIGSLDAVLCADDKWATYRRLAARGVAVPTSYLPGDPPTTAGPVVVKPRVGRGGRGVAVYAGPGAVPPQARDTVVQEFAPGTEYAVNVYRDDRGTEVVAVLEKTRLAQGRVGNGAAVRTCPAAEGVDVAELARRACAALGLTGPADVDVRRRRSGEPVVLEANARFGAHSAHAPELLDAVLARFAMAVPA